MSKPVLFVTGLGKDKARAENMMALYQAYPGEKEFISGHDPNAVSIIQSGKYDTMVIDVFPTVKPKRAIMIWHAIQGGKYIGLDQKGTYYKPEMKTLIDYIIAAGPAGVDMFHRCTGVDRDRILPLGMPRTDKYIGKKKGDGCTFMAMRTAYLYVPTFRNSREEPIPEINWNAIDNMLKDWEILAVKPHPYGKPFGLHGFRHIVELDKMEPTAPYLYDADVVITDYSSIMFDAALMEKPTVLFEKKKGYVENRGMYLYYPWGYSSRYANDEFKMIAEVRISEGLLTSIEKRNISYVAGNCDGCSCNRISRFIMEVNKDGD